MSHHNPIRTLFVSDQPGSVRWTRRILDQTDLGQCELESVSIETDVLRTFSENHYDICIIDCLRSGPLVIAELQRLGFTAPIIAFTGNSAAEVLDAIHQGAADCLLRDQLTAAALERAICGALDRAQNLESQAQSERCYLGLMENATEIIYTHDLDGNYTSINKAGERTTGYTSEEILQMNFRQVTAPEYLLSVWRAIGKMLANRKPGSFEAMILTKDNQRVHVQVSAHLLYKEGKPIGVQGIARQKWAISSFVADAERATPA